jgi:hypothetical protein
VYETKKPKKTGKVQRAVEPEREAERNTNYLGISRFVFGRSQFEILVSGLATLTEAFGVSLSPSRKILGLRGIRSPSAPCTLFQIHYSRITPTFDAIQDALRV